MVTLKSQLEELSQLKKLQVTDIFFVIFIEISKTTLITELSKRKDKSENTWNHNVIVKVIQELVSNESTVTLTQQVVKETESSIKVTKDPIGRYHYFRDYFV